MVAFTYSDHGASRMLYVFAYRRGAAGNATFQPAALGLPGRVYVYDYFRRRGKVLAAGATFHDQVGSGSYYLAAPIGPSGMALLGDLNRFVSVGRQRVARSSDTGRIHTVIRFGAGEAGVTLSGYAPVKPIVSAPHGRVGAVSYDPSRIFRVRVSPGTDETATLEIREPAG